MLCLFQSEAFEELDRDRILYFALRAHKPYFLMHSLQPPDALLNL